MKRRRSIFFLAAIGVAALALYLFREPLLNACFDFLVAGEEPAKADLAVVLAGDGGGNRIMKAGDLVREGFVPAALVSGPTGMYDTPESDLAIHFASTHGYPESYFIAFPIPAKSSQEEAALIVPELRKRNVKSILVVTNGYHTRRAGRYYKHIPGITARMIAARDRYAEHGTWWRNREGRKTMFMEWSKTIATVFGI